tara:strand:- start:457 stop:657 length:201 start_codon:yes stop_codon:yes gene_type:complete
MNYDEARKYIDSRIWTRDELRKLRGKAARRRDKSISDRLKQVHQPWHQRPTKDTIHNDGTILFDLT